MIRPHACIVSAVRPARDVRTFHREARSLARAGWNVSVIGRDSGPPAIVDDIQVLPLPPASGPGRALRQLRALRLALAARADVYQVADVELLPAAFLLRRLGRSVIYDCIEDYPAYMELKPWIPPPLRRPARLSVAGLERLVAPRLDAVFTADDGTAARLRGYGATVGVLHNFPRRDEFAPAPLDAPRTHDVVYHGSLPAYHLTAMAEIAAALAGRVPDARWTIVGDPDSAAARTAFGAMLAANGLGERVRLRRRIPFHQVPELLRATRTGIVPLPDVPKFRTNVPMKLFEFMAAGVPAVASDLPPTRGLLGDLDAAVLVPPGDHAAFAEAVAGLLGDRDRADRLARRGREAVEERFNWEREERTLLATYARLLCGPALGALAEELHA
jgi:glycosyltransferase involved in cell wall biosynthesis